MRFDMWAIATVIIVVVICLFGGAIFTHFSDEITHYIEAKTDEIRARTEKLRRENESKVGTHE